MTVETLRFIHAAGVLADHQVRDTGLCDENIRSTVIDATLTSFERIIESCVDHEVDFLLLTGDTFAESDRSLRARVAIKEGFECLEEAGIDVFVVPGSNDSPDAWASFRGLPDNVSLFVPEIDEPVAVMRHGTVLATLQACLGRSAASPTDHDESPIGQSRIGPFRIGIIPPFSRGHEAPDESIVDTWLSTHKVDYLAVPRPFPRLTVTRMDQIAHCPGPATSMSSLDSGPAGCSLVTIEARSTITTEQIVTSPIRREKIRITIGESATWDQLISGMRGYVESLSDLEKASVLILNWELSGCGGLHESLQNPEAEQELFELLEADSSLTDGQHMIHRLTLLSDSATSSDETLDEQEDNPLLSSFLQRIDSDHAIAASVVRRLNGHRQNVPEPWLRRVETLAGRIAQDAVATRCQQYGTNWFQPGSADSNDDDEED